MGCFSMILKFRTEEQTKVTQTNVSKTNVTKPSETNGKESCSIRTTEQKIRLDSYLAAQFPDMSRSHLQTLIRSGEILVGGKKVKSGYALSDGDEITVPEEKPAEELPILAEEIPLDIVYEDADVVVVNKPKGMVVHPAPGHYEGTLVNALMFHCKDSLSGINGMLRPGIVHRIDKDTTGLIIACKNDAAHNKIAEQLAVHSITRRYIALCWGNIREDELTVDQPIARAQSDRKKMAIATSGTGRRAVTHVRVLERFGSATLVECRLETGRTHQIRVHMAFLQHPLVGDPVYGRKKDLYTANGQYLHAAVLGFVHPRTGQYLEFQAPLPDYFEQALERFRICTR